MHLPLLDVQVLSAVHDMAAVPVRSSAHFHTYGLTIDALRVSFSRLGGFSRFWFDFPQPLFCHQEHTQQG